MSSTRYGNYRRSGRGRRQPQSDAIVVALTAQILVCVVVLLAAGVVKKVDEPDYLRFKEQYSAMATQENSLPEFIQQWSQGAGKVVGAIEGAFHAVVNRITGNESKSEVTQPDPAPKIAEEVEESTFTYDYTGPMEIDGGGGVGGWHPVLLAAGQEDQPLAAPEGSTLAPVMLGGRVLSPVEGLVTSRFSYRVHPISGNADFHTGLDIAAEEGRAILSALPGEVTEVGENDIYGLYVVVRHSDSLETSYSHCSEIIAKEGMIVRQGDRIAKVGSTGMVTGPHLHFSVMVEGTFTDPLWILEQNVRVME